MDNFAVRFQDDMYVLTHLHEVLGKKSTKKVIQETI